MEWISVDDRLPEDFESHESFYIVSSKGLVCFSTAFFKDGEFWSSKDFVGLTDVTHWMPLPEPPKDNQ